VLDVALGGADGVDHRLSRVGGLQGAPELATDPEPDHGERLLHPLAQRAGGAGVGVLQFVGEPRELLKMRSSGKVSAKGWRQPRLPDDCRHCRGFYAYALDEGMIARSPVALVRRPRVSDESLRLGVHRAGLRALLEAAQESSERDLRGTRSTSLP
jgi:hypothetical protein